MSKERTKARQLALQFLYQVDLRGREIIHELEIFFREIEESPVLPVGQAYAKELILGCMSHWEELDDKIKKMAKNWELSRMAVIDRTVLRIAIYELCYSPSVPPKVAINEAIELGKKFSTENSGAFINGILDHFLKTSREPAKVKQPNAEPVV